MPRFRPLSHVRHFQMGVGQIQKQVVRDLLRAHVGLLAVQTRQLGDKRRQFLLLRLDA
mgnify:CR=1 FL=1